MLLAAGGGTRYDGATHKLLAPFRGTTVVGAALTALVASGLAPLAVVTGAARFGAVPDAVEVLDNPAWAEGQATSLAVAVGRFSRGAGRVRAYYS